MSWIAGDPSAQAAAADNHAWCSKNAPLETRIEQLETSLISRHGKQVRELTAGDFNEKELRCLDSLFPPNLVSKKISAKLKRCLVKAFAADAATLISLIGIFVSGGLPSSKSMARAERTETYPRDHQRKWSREQEAKIH